ncbi:MAG: membrane lipoprotein lipid attachment site-containing protein [Bacteroidales bacterium]|nr:membrane lipoprotein lipid attachment site-containing protein [Bacteroidales bacterium]
MKKLLILLSMAAVLAGCGKGNKENPKASYLPGFWVCTERLHGAAVDKDPLAFEFKSYKEAHRNSNGYTSIYDWGFQGEQLVFSGMAVNPAIELLQLDSKHMKWNWTLNGETWTETFANVTAFLLDGKWKARYMNADTVYDVVFTSNGNSTWQNGSKIESIQWFMEINDNGHILLYFQDNGIIGDRFLLNQVVSDNELDWMRTHDSVHLKMTK